MRKTKSPYLSIVGWGMFLAGALTLGSCTNEDIPGKDEQGPAIEFGEVKTRAEVSEASQVKEFSVFAEQNYLNEDGSESTDFISLLDNERVYRIGTNMDGEFTYDNTRYWVNERTFRFFAVYPYMATGIARATLTQGESTYEYDGYTINFTTPATADTDLMASHRTALTTTSLESYPTVDFQFGHLLSKINIKVAKASGNADNKVVVKSVTLAKVKDSGVYNTSVRNEYTDNWVANTTTSSFTKTSNIEVDHETATAVLSEGNEFLLIPQEITGDANGIQVSINYDFYDPIYGKNEKDEDIITGYRKEGNYTVSGALPSNVVSNWMESKRYTYSIQLSSKGNEILFGTPTISNDWDVEKQIGGTIIIQ